LSSKEKITTPGAQSSAGLGYHMRAHAEFLLTSSASIFPHDEVLLQRIANDDEALVMDVKLPPKAN
jgi:hypothetical protein